MMRAQQYIQSLMENVAEGQIGSDEHRLTFARIRSRLSATEDFESELRHLYKVAGFGQFALSLMWIAERVEQNSAKTEYTPEEQTLVVSQFRYAVGDFDEPPVTEAEFPPAQESSAETLEVSVPSEGPADAAEESPEMPSSLEMGAPETPSSDQPAPPSDSGSTGESGFSTLMERFVEAMQSGSDDRDELVQSVLSQATAMGGGSVAAPDDLKEFCQYLVEFLQYIMENGFMDDVRVMNILSNVSGPVSSWAQAAPDAREGLLSEGTEILRSFKSLFE